MQLPVIRFSQTCTRKDRITKANEYINCFKPEWISLQYVPYGFNKKGMPFYLPATFEQFNTKAKWHIMFHETWVGMSVSSPFAHRMYGYFQKHILAILIKKLKPRLVTTTNRVYQLALQKKKISAACLPLFSNISVEKQDEDFISALEEKYKVDLKTGGNFKLGIFGTLYPEANLCKVVPAFIKEKGADKKVVIILFGKNSRPAELEKLKQALPSAVVVIELGELSAHNTSHIFKLLNEAVLCTPIEYLGKSGAYAALRLHEVKVATLSSAPITKYEKEIMQYNDYLFKRPSYKWSVQYIKDKFIALLD